MSPCLIKYGPIGLIAALVIAVAAIMFQMKDVGRMAATMPSQSDYRY